MYSDQDKPQKIVELSLFALDTPVESPSSDMVFEREASRCTTRIERQFTKDRLNMSIDGVRADYKALGYLLVAKSQCK